MIENILSDVPRPGTPKFFGVEQVVQIVALACEDPKKSQRPVSHWTPTELAQEAKKRGIVEKISSRSIETDPEAGWIFLVDQLNIHQSESLVRLVAQHCEIERDLGVKGASGILFLIGNTSRFFI